MKTLIIIDMQNDFITGSLANEDAKKIVKPICDYIKNFKGHIILTRDTHFDNYLTTQEGRYLPVEHCLINTEGWQINKKIQIALRGKQPDYINKNNFGFINFTQEIPYIPEEFILIGTCTDICVVSNALILKATYPNTKITVISSLCAGTTKQNHEAALQTMRMCQCEVI